MRNMRLKGKITEYVEGKDKIRLRDLLYHLNSKGKTIHGIRIVAGNLTSLGWRREIKGDDVYRRDEDEGKSFYD
jgi:hypothetical protein